MATYSTDRGAQAVRRYYRNLLQKRGWRIISNDPVREGIAVVTGRRGTKEVNVYLVPNDDGLEITVTLSDTRVGSSGR